MKHGSTLAPSSAAVDSLATGLRGWALLLALIVAGVAGNYFKYPIFLNIDFLFGSIFSLLALQFLGLGCGLVASALIGSYTYVLWNHPYAAVILFAEVLVVAQLIGRYRIGLVLADALYWLVVGMPLVYLFYHEVMNVPLGNTTIVMAKQAVNGITNALVARLIFTALMIKVRTSLIAYRDLIYNLLTFFALVPALILLVVASRVDYADTDQAIRTGLIRSSQQEAARLDVWLQNRSTSVISLARMAATLTPQQMQPKLEQVDETDANFLRAAVVNKEGIAVSFSPLVDELGQANLGKNYADRPFIPRLKESLKPLLSEVVMAKVGVPAPIVSIIAPVVVNGGYGGYVAGILDLTQVREYLEQGARSDTLLYTLRDKNGNIILTNRPEQKVMTPMTRGPGNLNRLDADISQWVPTAAANTPISERWKSSFYVREAPVGKLAEWTLTLEQPVAPFQKKLYARYTEALALLLLLLMVALALAEVMSRRVVSTTEQLSELTHNLPHRLKTGQRADWPESALLEPHYLIENFKEMEATLAAQLAENKKLNASLERRVGERTSELGLRMEELKRSNADLEQFAYAASHDMRQPLRMITSYLQLLAIELEPLLDEETRRNFHFATDGAQRMDKMLTALLDYSRTGRTGGDMALIDSRTVLDEALHTLQPAIDEAQATLRIEGDWPRLWASHDELQRLLQNLIDNALKYRLEGRAPALVVSAERAGEEWRFTVKDNGVGLIAGQETRLFKVFERLQPRAKYPGTGIGLALCRKIVEHHGGHIWVESPGENQGASFIFTLPVAPVVPLRPDEPAAAPEGAAHE